MIEVSILILIHRQLIVVFVRDREIELVHPLIDCLPLLNERVLVPLVQIRYRVVFKAVFEIFYCHEELASLERVETRQPFEIRRPRSGVECAELAGPDAMAGSLQ